MDIGDVYAKIEEQLDQNLPFVVYRKADSMSLHAVFQKNNQIYEVKPLLFLQKKVTIALLLFYYQP